jgi:hypothetical protein
MSQLPTSYVQPPPPKQGLGQIPASDILLVFIISLSFVLYGDNILVEFFASPIEGEQVATPNIFAAYLIGSLLVDISAVYLIILRKQGLYWRDLGLCASNKPGMLRLGLLLGLIALPLRALVDGIVSGVIDPPDLGQQAQLILGETSSQGRLIFLIGVVGICNPIVQEVLFRGLLFGWLKAHMDLRWAVVISALIFGATLGLVFFLPSLMILGVIYALLREYSGSLWPGILAHSTLTIFHLIHAYQVLGAGELSPA